MTLTLLAIAIAIICAIVLTWATRSKNKSELDRHSIFVEQLQSMMVSGQKVLLFDARQPLDLLAYSELIPLKPLDERLSVNCPIVQDSDSENRLSGVRRARNYKLSE